MCYDDGNQTADEVTILETIKLYYADSHATTCTSRILSCREVQGGWEVVTDATVFYPQGGGQAADRGTLGRSRVLDVREQGDEVVHLCDCPLNVGETVQGTIDWSYRFDLMQQHSGEHILSGVLHRRFGVHNVGFHMGSEMVTVDFDGVIPPEALADVEREVNEAVWQNLPVRCWIPTPEELKDLPYRRKRDLSWPVRIVEVPGYDSCACCGTHVKYTGEIGLVKIFSAISFRGGTRMEMACGGRAFSMLSTAFEENRRVSQEFSAKWQETGNAARQMTRLLEEEKALRAELQKKMFAAIAREYACRGNVLHFQPDADSTQVRILADTIAQSCGGTAAVFSGADGQGYSYALVTRQGDLRPLGSRMTDALSGRGGGKPVCQQGRVMAAETDIRAFFEKLADWN